MENEEVEIRHRRHGFHDLGQTHEPAPERRPRHVVRHQQCSHGAARAAIGTDPVPLRFRMAIKVERRQRPDRPSVGHVYSWTTANVRMHTTKGLGDAAACQATVPIPPGEAVGGEPKGRNVPLATFAATVRSPSDRNHGKDARR